MGDETTTPPAAGPGTTLLCALLAAAGTAAMSVAAASLQESALSGHASQALIAWVLVTIAALGTLLCLYLAVIWTLAAVILLAGPATRTGTALLLALKLLAPRLARRVTTGAAAATTATALVLAPSMAAESPPAPTSLSEHAPAQTSQLLPTDGVTSDPAPEAAGPGAAQDSSGSGSTAPLPALGWGGTAPAAPADAAAPTVTPSDTDGGETPTTPHTVVVRSGDSLWSISDDLLGPASSDPAEIAAAWPMLHEANHDVIGTDPDQLFPGMELTVPASLTTKDLP